LGKGKNFYGGSIPPERGMKMNKMRFKELYRAARVVCAKYHSFYPVLDARDEALESARGGECVSAEEALLLSASPRETQMLMRAYHARFACELSGCHLRRRKRPKLASQK